MPTWPRSPRRGPRPIGRIAPTQEPLRASRQSWQWPIVPRGCDRNFLVRSSSHAPTQRCETSAFRDHGPPGGSARRRRAPMPDSTHGAVAGPRLAEPAALWRWVVWRTERRPGRECGRTPAGRAAAGADSARRLARPQGRAARMRRHPRPTPAAGGSVSAHAKLAETYWLWRVQGRRRCEAHHSFDRTARRTRSF